MFNRNRTGNRIIISGSMKVYPASMLLNKKKEMILFQKYFMKMIFEPIKIINKALLVKIKIKKIQTNLLINNKNYNNKPQFNILNYDNININVLDTNWIKAVERNYVKKPLKRTTTACSSSCGSRGPIDYTTPTREEAQRWRSEPSAYSSVNHLNFSATVFNSSYSTNRSTIE